MKQLYIFNQEFAKFDGICFRLFDTLFIKLYRKFLYGNLSQKTLINKVKINYRLEFKIKNYPTFEYINSIWGMDFEYTLFRQKL